MSTARECYNCGSKGGGHYHGCPALLASTGGVALPPSPPGQPSASAGPDFGDRPLDRLIAAAPFPQFDMIKRAPMTYANSTAGAVIPLLSGQPSDRHELTTTPLDGQKSENLAVKSGQPEGCELPALPKEELLFGNPDIGDDIWGYSADQMRQQRQEGRRDAHETNMTLLGENCALSEKLNAMRSAFHQNMLRAFPGKSHAEIDAEITKGTGVAALAARQAPDGGRGAADAARWQFMMRVADDDEGPEALAINALGNAQMETDRPESEQLNELVDQAIALVAQEKAK